MNPDSPKTILQPRIFKIQKNENCFFSWWAQIPTNSLQTIFNTILAAWSLKYKPLIQKIFPFNFLQKNLKRENPLKKKVCSQKQNLRTLFSNHLLPSVSRLPKEQKTFKYTLLFSKENQNKFLQPPFKKTLTPTP